MAETGKGSGIPEGGFKDRKQLEAWLEGQPREVAIAIAWRSAARVVPLLAGEKPDAVLLPVLSSLSFSRVAAVWPKYITGRFEDAARTAAAAAAAARGAASGGFSPAPPAASAASAAAYAASSVHGYYRNSSHTVSAVTSAATAAANVAPAGFAASYFDSSWLQATLDAELCEERGIEALNEAPIWFRLKDSVPVLRPPNWARDGWERLRSELEDQPQEHCWFVWIDWYSDIFFGKPGLTRDRDIESGRLFGHPDAGVEITENDWKAGSSVVNPKMRQVLDWFEVQPNTASADIAEGVDADESEVFPQWDFFISYSTKDEAMAKRIGEILREAGYLVFAQYLHFEPGSNFIREMQRGLADSGRVIALYSPDYANSDHCQAEWAAAYNEDPGGKKRKLIPFLLKPTKLPPLARQIIFTNLTGLRGKRLRQAVRDAVKYVTPIRSRAELQKKLAEVASPVAAINEDGKVDLAPNPKLDVPFVDQDLAELPEIQRAICEALIEGLPANAPRIVSSSLNQYRKHLQQHGAQPILGFIKPFAAAIEAEYLTEDGDTWGEGLKSLIDDFLANHQLLITHFPLDPIREQVFAETQIDEEEAVGSALSEPLSAVAEVVNESPEIVTESFAEAVDGLNQFGKDIASLPPGSSSNAQPDTVVTPRRRYILTVLGFLERTYNLVASTLTIASTPQGVALLVVLKQAVEALMKFVL